MRNKDIYNPRPKAARILTAALEFAQSVDYKVSTRWVFYRLLQASLYSGKSAYKNWIAIESKARHAGWGGWSPDTLADGSRSVIPWGYGYDNERAWINAVGRAECILDPWLTQPRYVELWYEARAMTDQFSTYSERITLRPMGGSPSIAYKKEAAKGLEAASGCYGKPITVLYFGDLDSKGLEIATTIQEDVRKWCSVDFTFIRVGLTQEQVSRYAVPENPEHPGAFQWEALDDQAAREIITGSLSNLFDRAALETVKAREKAVETWLSKRIGKIAAEYQD